MQMFSSMDLRGVMNFRAVSIVIETTLIKSKMSIVLESHFSISLLQALS